ncbi:MAG: deoxyguanosinetriphosphate triphosphohydrolase [Planctomycetaceae bacterium]|nr:deoxyguanosinetriphosphate triphosphohydrolase [Planctomycetaceae bacterium]
MSDPLTPLQDGMIPAAMRAERSQGRRHREEEHPYRNPFQRDRDRVVHSAHFRRLEYKTQVFVNGEGDNYRTRLTHTLEVSQIARSIARALRLNEDLAEAVALSHDLGHTPFGHAGERVLDSLMQGQGGFNHNAQGLRIVDLLESRYVQFDGLNLTYEVREAFVRHGGPCVAAGCPEFSALGAPLLEVAATLAADDIAYLAHDIDDGLYANILSEEQLQSVDLWREVTAGEKNFASFPKHLKRTTGVRRLINVLVTDLVDETKTNLDRKGLTDPEALRDEKETLLDFSPRVEEKKSALKEFLFHNFYRHPNVMRVMEEAQETLRQLWEAYAGGSEKMPLQYRQIADSVGVKRAAADYVSGMTDRFAREDWDRIRSGEKKSEIEKKPLTR